MKRIFIATALCLPLIAGATEIGSPYLGLDAQWRTISLKGTNRDLRGSTAPLMNIFGGVRVSSLVGLEAGIQAARITRHLKLSKLRSIHASLLFYKPLNNQETLNLIGGLGLAHMSYTIKHPAYRIDVGRCVPRLTGGLEFSASPRVKVRTLFVWESAQSVGKKTPTLKNSYGASFGALVSF